MSKIDLYTILILKKKKTNLIITKPPDIEVFLEVFLSLNSTNRRFFGSDASGKCWIIKNKFFPFLARALGSYPAGPYPKLFSNSAGQS